MGGFICFFFFFKQKTAYEITYGDWSSDVCSSDLKILQPSHNRRSKKTAGRPYGVDESEAAGGGDAGEKPCWNHPENGPRRVDADEPHSYPGQREPEVLKEDRKHQTRRRSEASQQEISNS